MNSHQRTDAVYWKGEVTHYAFITTWTRDWLHCYCHHHAVCSMTWNISIGYIDLLATVFMHVQSTAFLPINTDTVFIQEILSAYVS